MKNLKSIVQYECFTSFKYIWLFYAIQYAIVGFITLIVGLASGTFDDIGSKCLETNTLIYISILGVMGFKEDFKMLIQNGFSRKYIFIATLSMFAFISGVMALIDTITGTLLHYFSSSYFSMYGALYGYRHSFINWLWLFLLYMIFCCLMYFVILLINKIGRTASVCLAAASGGIILLVIALFRYVLSAETVSSILEFLAAAMGFTAGGAVNRIIPLLTLSVLAAVFAAGAYAIIRRTELKE